MAAWQVYEVVRLLGRWTPPQALANGDIGAAAERIAWGQLGPAWHPNSGDRLAREIRRVAALGGGIAEVSEFLGRNEFRATVTVEVLS